MKILAILCSYTTCQYTGKVGGGEISNRVVLEELANRGHDIIVSIPYSNQNQNELINSNVKIFPVSPISISSGFLKKYMCFLGWKSNAIKLLNNFTPDVIIASTYGVPLANRLASIYKIPSIALVRAFENFPDVNSGGYKKNTLRWFKKIALGDFGLKCLSDADFIITNSIFMKGKLENSGVSTPVSVVYPTLSSSSCERMKRNHPFRFTMVGTSEKKGVKTFLALAKCFPNVSFKILGGDWLTEIEKFPENVEVKGWTNTVDEFRNNSDAVLVPSLWEEPFGRVAIEGIQSGCVVIASNIGGLPETLAYQKKLLVESDDIDDWCSRVGEYIENPIPFWEAAFAAQKKLSVYKSDRQIDSFENTIFNIADSSRG